MCALAFAQACHSLASPVVQAATQQHWSWHVLCNLSRAPAVTPACPSPAIKQDTVSCNTYACAQPAHARHISCHSDGCSQCSLRCHPAAKVLVILWLLPGMLRTVFEPPPPVACLRTRQISERPASVLTGTLCGQAENHSLLSLRTGGHWHTGSEGRYCWTTCCRFQDEHSMPGQVAAFSGPWMRQHSACLQA